jgi:hypothetical protein
LFSRVRQRQFIPPAPNQGEEAIAGTVAHARWAYGRIIGSGKRIIKPAIAFAATVEIMGARLRKRVPSTRFHGHLAFV